MGGGADLLSEFQRQLIRRASALSIMAAEGRTIHGRSHYVFYAVD
jgi:hypothetical protein